MANTVTLTFVGDANQLSRTFNQLSSASKKFSDDTSSHANTVGDRMKSMAEKTGTAMRVASTAVVGAGVVVGTVFGRQIIESAAKAEQAVGAVDAVFKSNAGQIHEWAKNSASALGLSSAAYSQMSAVVGSQLKNLGMPTEDVTRMTNDLITKGADLAAMFGGPTSSAVEALSALLRGERDPIEQYGVSINDAMIQAKLAEKGLKGLDGAALKNAETMAALEILTQQTADATGQFAREANTTSGQLERNRAAWENIKVEMGEKLLPMVNKLMPLFGELAGTLIPALLPALESLATTIINNADNIRLMVEMLAGVIKFAVEHPVIVGAFLAITQVVGPLTAAVRLLNLAFLATPIGLIVAGAALIVAGIVMLWNKSAAFRDFFIGVWNTITNGIGAAVTAIRNAFSSAADFVKNIWGGVLGFFQALPGKIIGFFGNIGTGIKNIFKGAVNGIIDMLNGGIGLINSLIRGINNVSGVVGIPAIPSIPKIPRLHTGGVVPGVLGSEQLAILQAGERVIPRGQSGNETSGAVEFVGDLDSAFAVFFQKMVREGRIRIA